MAGHWQTLVGYIAECSIAGSCKGIVAHAFNEHLSLFTLAACWLSHNLQTLTDIWQTLHTVLPSHLPELIAHRLPLLIHSSNSSLVRLFSITGDFSSLAFSVFTRHVSVILWLCILALLISCQPLNVN